MKKHRLAFLTLLGILAISIAAEERADVVVVAATPSGVGAAVAAAN